MKFNTPTTIALAAGFFLIAERCPCATASPSTGEKAERLDIIAYCMPPAAKLSVAHFREMAECGFTAGIPVEQNYDAAATDAMLKAAAEAGMKVFVNQLEVLKNPEAVAAKFRGNPATAGYFVVDEPTWGPSGWNKTQYTATPLKDVKLGEIVARLKAADPGHPAYINLFPNYARPPQLGTATYQEYVDRFVAEAPGIDFISFDNYPIENYRVRADWYENLEIISKAARGKGIPFWAFALTSTHFNFTPATPEHLRLQMHVNLAYGAQGLQYFPYWAPNASHWHAPINFDGKRGELYDHVRELNAELQLLAPVFKGAKVLDTGHTGAMAQWRPGDIRNPAPWPRQTGPIPKGTRHYKPAAPVVKFSARGQYGAVVSTLQKTDKRHLVIVNKDYAHAMTLEITFDGSREIQTRAKDGSSKAIAGNRFESIVPPAGLVVLSWTEKEAP
jgi:hypothetical protein